jgi:hypothetical protein
MNEAGREYVWLEPSEIDEARRVSFREKANQIEPKCEPTHQLSSKPECDDKAGAGIDPQPLRVKSPFSGGPVTEK